jgi:C1A family cysteine protease
MTERKAPRHVFRQHVSATMEKRHGYGWRPDRIDDRYRQRQLEERWTADLLAAVPVKPVDMRPRCPPPYDQGPLHSSPANVVAFLYQYDCARRGALDFMPSRLFIYWNQRRLSGDDQEDEDTGATIVETIDALNDCGVPDEKEWPYSAREFDQEPPHKVFNKAHHDRRIVPHALLSLEDIRAALQADFPVAFGFHVFEGFEGKITSASGVVAVPSNGDKIVAHQAAALVGDNPDKKHMIFRNSFGPDWGHEGCGYIPYEYLFHPMGLTGDFWIIETAARD